MAGRVGVKMASPTTERERSPESGGARFADLRRSGAERPGRPAVREAATVAELRELAGGRLDLLAEVAGIFEGASEGQLDEPLARCAADLCRKAGAGETLIPQWVAEGKRSAANAPMRPHGYGPDSGSPVAPARFTRPACAVSHQYRHKPRGAPMTSPDHYRIAEQFAEEAYNELRHDDEAGATALEPHSPGARQPRNRRGDQRRPQHREWFPDWRRGH